MENREYKPIYTFKQSLIDFRTISATISHFKVRIVESILDRIKKALHIFPKADPPLEKYSPEERKLIFEDPFAVYIPYHLDPENWGIYIRVNWILEDIKRYMMITVNFTELDKRLCDLGYQGILHASCDAYFTHIVKHVLVHHVMEDIALIIEDVNDNYGKVYPLINDKCHEDEFAEYFSFSTYGLTTYYVFREALRNIFAGPPLVKFMFKVIHGTFQSSLAKMKDYFEQITKPLEVLSDILYHYWKINNIMPCRPVLRAYIIKKVHPLWRPITFSHMGFAPPLVEALPYMENIPENVRNALKHELHERVFATTV